MFLKDYKYIVEVATFAGLIMLESNAECYRVENTVSRILKISNLPTIDVFANTTGLFITLDGPNLKAPITFVKRIEKRETNLRKIHIVNQISRDITAQTITIEEANRQLHSISKTVYSKRIHSISTVLLVLSFTALFGGNINELFLSFIAAILLLGTYKLKQYFELNDFIFGTVSTLIVATIIPIIIHVIGQSDNSFNVVIISVLMPLFPGTAFTNGFRDTFKGDYGSGVAKIVEALIVAISLGLGVALGLFISKGIVSWV